MSGPVGLSLAQPDPHHDCLHFRPGRIRLALARFCLAAASRLLPEFTVWALSPCVIKAVRSENLRLYAENMTLRQELALASLPADELPN